MPLGLGPGELLIVLVIVMIFFGVGRLGEVGGALGRGLREFRHASQGVDGESDSKTSEGDESTDD